MLTGGLLVQNPCLGLVLVAGFALFEAREVTSIQEILKTITWFATGERGHRLLRHRFDVLHRHSPPHFVIFDPKVTRFPCPAMLA